MKLEYNDGEGKNSLFGEIFHFLSRDELSDKGESDDENPSRLKKARKKYEKKNPLSIFADFVLRRDRKLKKRKKAN